MSGSITLHPKLGVNPHLCFCPRCGGDAPELMLIGNRTNKRRCRACKTLCYGTRLSEPCPACQAKGHHVCDWEEAGTILEGEKLPGGLCAACEKEIEQNKAVLAEGGIFFKCKECKKEGMIKASAPICAMVREKLGVPTPARAGSSLRNATSTRGANETRNNLSLVRSPGAHPGP